MELPPPEDLRIPDEIWRELAKPEIFQRYINDGRSLQELIGYSEEVMQDFYAVACSVLKDGRFVEAQDSFLFLTALNPYVYAYWLGLGMCYQRLEEYEQAIVAYECAIEIDSNDPVPSYYLAICHMLLNQTAASEQALDTVLEKCRGRKEYKDLLKRALEVESRLRRKK